MWNLHHVNIGTAHVRRTVEFFETVFGMKEAPFPFEIDNRGVFRDTEDFVAFFEDGPRQIHVCQPMPELPRDNGFCLNPLLHGHVAITVPDITEVRRRLDRLGVYVADAGRWAYKGYYQIYCYDPALNVVEINSPIEGPPPASEPGRDGWQITSVSIPAIDLAASSAFYREAFGMEQRTWPAGRDADRAVVELFCDGSSEVHLSRPEPWIIARRQLRLDPILDGHFGVAVDDLAAVRDRL
ncbi:MAG TPA: VOC family protein, partial [Acidimicrobiia bacterium]|nr:VOC family protein [Acidimicrobiia bacterium]